MEPLWKAEREILTKIQRILKRDNQLIYNDYKFNGSWTLPGDGRGGDARPHNLIYNISTHTHTFGYFCIEGGGGRDVDKDDDLSFCTAVSKRGAAKSHFTRTSTTSTRIISKSGARRGGKKGFTCCIEYHHQPMD